MKISTTPLLSFLIPFRFNLIIVLTFYIIKRFNIGRKLFSTLYHKMANVILLVTIY